MADTSESTHKLFTYNVNMLINVFAEDEDLAKTKLDAEGGYVSKREVSLIKTITLHDKFGQ